MPSPNRIREVREAKGVTLRELGDRIGADFGYVGKMERGENEVSLTWLGAIAPALECSPVELLPEEMAPPDLVELAAILERLSPEDQAALMRVAKALSKGSMKPSS